MNYTIKKCTLENFLSSDADFIALSADAVNKMYGNKFKWHSFPILKFVRDQHLWICYRDKSPVGFMAASLYKNFFDMDCKILKQQLLFAIPGTRAPNLLLKEFVDFGKIHANHVITMIAKETNIKPRSLERLGFSSLEELYRLEV